MLGNFTYCNPTKLYFGKESIKGLNKELPKYGKNVLLVYGGGSIKKSGIYDEIVKILKENGKEIFEDAGVMPNPTVEKLNEGMEIARKSKADFILAVGGGSVCDYAKAVSVSVNCKEDAWEKYYIRFEDVDKETKIIPIGCVLTMVGTGSEMNGGSVITNHSQKLKIGHVFGENVFPKFSILNPEYTFTLPKYQMVSGIYDIMSHILEHFTNPKYILNSVHNFIGGGVNDILFIEIPYTPNYKIVLKDDMKIFFETEHTVHFNEKNISLLMKECNFKILDICYNEYNINDNNLKKNIWLGKFDFKSSINFLYFISKICFNPKNAFIDYKISDNFNFGRNIRIIAAKNN